MQCISAKFITVLACQLAAKAAEEVLHNCAKVRALVHHKVQGDVIEWQKVQIVFPGATVRTTGNVCQSAADRRYCTAFTVGCNSAHQLIQ